MTWLSSILRPIKKRSGLATALKWEKCFAWVLRADLANVLMA